MGEALCELMRRFPPPAKPRSTPVNWADLEAALGLCYPAQFKEFIDAYGGCVWFGHLSPFFRQALTRTEAREFPEKVVELCDIDRGNTYDANFDPISPPFFPERGGLMPFLVDYGGNMYYWDTNGDDMVSLMELQQASFGLRCAGWLRWR